MVTAELPGLEEKDIELNVRLPKTVSDQERVKRIPVKDR